MYIFSVHTNPITKLNRIAIIQNAIIVFGNHVTRLHNRGPPVRGNSVHNTQYPIVLLLTRI